MTASRWAGESHQILWHAGQHPEGLSHLWRSTLHERCSGGMDAACSQNSLQLMLLPRRMQAAADARARVAADARRQAALQREAARKEARAREEADAMEHLRAFKESIKGAASRVSSCKRLRVHLCKPAEKAPRLLPSL